MQFFFLKVNNAVSIRKRIKPAGFVNEIHTSNYILYTHRIGLRGENYKKKKVLKKFKEDLN